MHTAKECNLNSNATPATHKPVKKPIKDKSADAITLSNALASIMETQDDDDDSNQGEDDVSVTG